MIQELFKILEEHTGEKGSFMLYFNEHKTVYANPHIYYLDQLEKETDEDVDLEKDVYWLCWYKDTPIGSYHIYGNSIESIYSKLLTIISRLKNND